jgi:hypothetical protein
MLMEGKGTGLSCERMSGWQEGFAMAVEGGSDEDGGVAVFLIL